MITYIKLNLKYLYKVNYDNNFTTQFHFENKRFLE